MEKKNVGFFLSLATCSCFQKRYIWILKNRRINRTANLSLRSEWRNTIQRIVTLQTSYLECALWPWKQCWLLWNLLQFANIDNSACSLAVWQQRHGGPQQLVRLCKGTNQVANSTQTFLIVFLVQSTQFHCLQPETSLVALKQLWSCQDSVELESTW